MLDLKNENSTITNIVSKNSEIQLLQFHGFSDLDINIGGLIFSNISISNSTYTTGANIIDINNFDTTNDQIFMKINNLKFENLTFQGGGNLIKISCETKVPIQINSLSIKNTTDSVIFLDHKYNSEMLDFLKLEITNFTAVNNELKSTTLIIVKKLSKLTISNSVFENNFGYQSGNIASITHNSGQISFFNTTFTHNAAIEGGLFKIIYSGLLYCTN
jgi:hypothetical protein